MKPSPGLPWLFSGHWGRTLWCDQKTVGVTFPQSKNIRRWWSCFNLMTKVSLLYISSNISIFFHPTLGIAPITAVTHRDKLNSQQECDNALHQASAATGSSSDHTFFVHNYTRDNSKRNPETERMIFDILHCALLTAEKAVKVMKQREMEEDAKAVNSVEGNIAWTSEGVLG